MGKGREGFIDTRTQAARSALPGRPGPSSGIGTADRTGDSPRVSAQIRPGGSAKAESSG
jgi:hypothetical protein